jgi:hypothetical protein
MTSRLVNPIGAPESTSLAPTIDEDVSCAVAAPWPPVVDQDDHGHGHREATALVNLSVDRNRRMRSTLHDQHEG